MEHDRLIAAMLFCFALLSLFEVTQFFVFSLVYGQVSQLVTDLFEFGLRILFRRKQIRKFYLQTLDRG